MDLYVLLQAVPVGWYVSGYKVLPLLLITLLWWRLLTWIDKDAPAARLPRELINCGMAGAYVVGMLLFLLIPAGFWVALAVYLVLMLGSIGAYLGLRNQQVGLKDLADDLKNMSFFKGGGGRKRAEEVPGVITLATRDGRAMQSPEPESPERPAYDMVQMMLTDPLRRRTERVDLAPIEGAMMTQYWVDGVMYNGPQFNRATAAAAITILKQLAGLDINEKRKPQKGFIQATIDGKKHELEIQTAGSTSGETLRVRVDIKHRHELKLEQMGFAPEQLQQIDAAVSEPGGVVLLAVPRGQGLTTLAYATIRKHDAFLSHIHAIEREPEDDLEGITQDKLARSATPAEELQTVQWVVSQEPDAILMPAVQNPKSARDLIAFAGAGKRVYIGMHSNSATDAISEWRQFVGDDDLATKHLRMVIAGRLVRKLCPACKQPYQPDAETLRKLNLDHGRTQQFYQARTQPLVDQKGNPVACTFCQEMRYHGRTGVYEVMDVNDEVRQAIMTNSSVNQLRALFRKMRGRFVQEYALSLVERGETSIQEVLRAMRGQEQDPRVAKGASPSGSGTFTSSSSGSAAAKSHHPHRPKNSGM